MYVTRHSRQGGGGGHERINIPRGRGVRTTWKVTKGSRLAKDMARSMFNTVPITCILPITPTPHHILHIPQHPTRHDHERIILYKFHFESMKSYSSATIALASFFSSGLGFQHCLQHERCHPRTKIQIQNQFHRHPIARSGSDGSTAILPITAIAAAAASITSAQDISGKTFDLAVIGAGPVGVSAALRAARHPYQKNVVLIDAPRASGMLMDERTGEDLSLGGPTGLFSKALRDTGKRISVSSLKGMGLRDDR